MVEIRSITDDEIVDYYAAVNLGFGGDLAPEDDPTDRFGRIHQTKNTLVAIDDGRFVATFGHFDFDLTVPGSRPLAMAGTTVVTVLPTHRRRGIAAEMMRTHLNQVADAGTPLAGLWASDERIYGRFGYGTACYGVELAVDAGRVTFAPGPSDVSLRMIDADAATTVVPGIYEKVQAVTPGLLSRTEGWWHVRFFDDPKGHRGGASRRRWVIAERDGQPVGYVAYRQREKEEVGVSAGTVELTEMIAIDDEVRRSLWDYLGHIDLYPHIKWWNAPIDDPLYLDVDRHRLVQRVEFDSLWLRPLDVVAILEARRYEHDSRVVIGVDDPFLDKGGRFALEVLDGIGHCQATEAAPEIELDIGDLGALYLGGRSVHRMARSGRVQGSAEALLRTHQLFATARPPFCIEVF